MYSFAGERYHARTSRRDRVANLGSEIVEVDIHWMSWRNQRDSKTTRLSKETSHTSFTRAPRRADDALRCAGLLANEMFLAEAYTHSYIQSVHF